MEYFSKILHIDVDENSQSAIERLLSLDDHDIIITIPNRSFILGAPSELKMLKQEIDKSGKNIVIVSQDKAGIELAKDIGLKVEEEFLELLAPDEDDHHKYSADTHAHPRVLDIVYPHSKYSPNSIGKKLKEAKTEKYQNNFIEKRKMSAEENIIDDVQSNQQEQNSNSKVNFLRKITVGWSPSLPKAPVLIVIFIAIAFVVSFMAVFVILPESNVEITPRKETAILTATLSADISLAEPDFSQNKIPGQIIELEKEQTSQFAASGKISGDSKASGKIIIYNSINPPQAQTLVKTTRFESSGGKIFRTTQNITVPQAKIDNGSVVPGTIEADVIADAPGEDSNIGPSDFTVPGLKGSAKYSFVYGKSTSSMIGGSSGESGAVTSDDISNAKKEVLKQLSDSVKNDLVSKLPQDLKLIDNAFVVKILEEKSSHQVGAVTNNFSVSIKVSAKAFLFQEEDIKYLIGSGIKEKMGASEIDLGEMRIVYSAVDADFVNKILSLTLSVEQDITAKINEDEIKNAFVGKNEEEIKSYIEGQKTIDSAQISFWPKFIKTAPKNPDRINVLIKE